MATSHLNLIRNSRVFISTTDNNSDMKAANTFELNVLDGFSFTQTTATAEITLNEAGTNPDRGKKSYNTARNPVDWSFTTYIRPYKREATPSGGSATKYTSAVEKLMWEAFLGKGRTTGTNTDTKWTPFDNFNEGATTTGMEGDTDDSDVDVYYLCTFSSSYLTAVIRLTTVSIKHWLTLLKLTSVSTELHKLLGVVRVKHWKM